MENNAIDRTMYPELDMILWDEHARFISRQRAFHIYETRFHFIEKNCLSDKETQLIEDLSNEFGQGVMLTK